MIRANSDCEFPADRQPLFSNSLFHIDRNSKFLQSCSKAHQATSTWKIFKTTCYLHSLERFSVNATIFNDSPAIMDDKTAPKSQLRLEWVYGYRGHQCRNNLYYNHVNNVVYFVAGVGIVYDVNSRKQRFFIGHTDDIISLALHPEKQLVATGQIGNEPFICIWDSDTCETVSILKDVHERGITCLSFSTSGQHITSVGLDDHSMLSVWDWKKGKSIALTRGHNDRVFDVKFNPYNDNELATCGVKHIKFWNLCGNALTSKKGAFGQVGEIQTMLCLAYGSNGVVYSGTLSGDVYKWHKHKLVSSISSGHKGGIFTMDTTPDGYATGSKDGTAALWDPEFNLITRIDFGSSAMGYNGLAVRSVCWNGEKILAGTNGGEIFEVVAGDKDKPVTIIQGHADGELWALAVHPKKEVFVTGCDDKTVRLWDMSSTCMIARATFDVEIRSAAFSIDGLQICIGHTDGSFRILKGRDLSELVQIKDRKEVLHEMKYSPDGSWLAVGSNDNFVDIYAVNEKYKRVGQCKGSSSFITHLDWSNDSKYLQTNSGASERLFYKMPAGKRITKTEEIESIKWETWTCVLGNEVNGIWGKYANTDDINAADANLSQGVVVTGDDFGFVKLFKFPCLKKGAKFKKYVGHSAHVTNVRFSCHGSRVVTTGGADRAIFQWRLITTGSSGNSPREIEAKTDLGVDSCDEETDSDLSDVDALDSDIEQEASQDYQRQIYKEDLQVIQKKLTEQEIAKDTSTAVNKVRPRAPTRGIQLDFVFGYRGHDCRNNLFYTQSGDIVYHVSAVGIIYNPQARKQRFYLGHDDDILSLTLHPTKDLVATGQVGRDPTIHIWSMNTTSTVSILKGHHERGICAMDFSGDGKRLASVGLDENHCIVIWDWRRGEKLAITRGHKDKIFEIKWHPVSYDDLVTVGMKHIKFWTRAGGGFTSKRGTFGDAGKPETMLCASYSKKGDMVYSGAANGMVYIWENMHLKSTVQAHTGPLYALKSLEKGFVTGGKDGIVSLWDESLSRCLKSYKIANSNLEKDHSSSSLLTDCPAVRSVCLGSGKILIGTRNSEIIEIEKAGPIRILMQGHCEGELWGLAQHPSTKICATASDDGTLRLWDMEHNYLKHTKALGQPARCVAFSPDGKIIAVGLKNGSFKAFNSKSLEEIIGFHHRKSEISDLKFSPGEVKYLAVASHENFIDIYNVLQQSRVGICKGASSYITHIDWDETGKLLQVNTGARELLYFEAPRGKRQVVSAMELANINWSTWTSVLGEHCDGIWAPGSDVTDINGADLTKDRTLLATGDDFGFVKLFHYPTKGKNAKYKKYNGHSAHVTNVRWSFDDSCLVTVGGADTSVMVWTHQSSAEMASDQNSRSAVCDDSDTDSEEDSGFDSDVEREKNMNYKEKTYATNVRDTDSVRPTSQQEEKRYVPKVTRKSKGGSLKGHRLVNRNSNGDIKSLTLEVIHGYRGFDSRNNIHYTSSGDVVYHAASAGIVMSQSTKMQSFYLEHTDDIICLTVNQNPKFKNVTASGQIGEDPTVRIWDSDTKETLSVLRGHHKMGVCAVDFSSSGRYLLSVDLSAQHSIVVWRWAEGTKIASAKGSSHRIFVAEFRPQSDTSFVTCGVKHVMFWEVTGGSLLGKRGNLSSLSTTEDVNMQTMLSVAFGQDNVTFTGSMSGDVYVWSRSSLSRIVGQAHTGPIFTMETTLKDGLVAIGGKDKTGKNGGVVKVWDQDMKRCRTYQVKTSQNNPIVKAVCRGGPKNTLLVGTANGEVIEINEKSSAQQVLVQGHGEGEIWGAATHPDKNIFYTGSDDCTLRIWDFNTKAMKETIGMSAGVRSIAVSPGGELLCVGLKNGEFAVYNGTSLQLLGKKRDRSATVNSVRFSPDGCVLAVGAQDKSLDFYDCRPGGSLARLGYCKCISSFVISMDFSSDGKFLQVDTGSYQRLVFTVPDGSSVTETSVIDSIQWSSWSSTTGKDVLGIWPKDSKKGDINCADLSKSGSNLATGDDFGYVRIFPFPCTEKFTKGTKFTGHSAHVTNVRFSYDDSYLVSTGGDDSCIFVWRCD